MSSFDWMTLLTGAISAIIGGFIGTYFGAFFINKDIKKKNEDARKIAINALNIFKKYKNKKYEDASNDFNVSLSRAEKRIILVALHKIGIPIANERLIKSNDYTVSFRSELIQENDIEAMKGQIRSGKYDHLFFDDPDEYFSRNALRDYKRSIAIKYINNVFANTRVSSVKKFVQYPDGWMKNFSFGEMNIVLIIKEKLLDTFLYEDTTGLPKQQCIQDIINEINMGLWDAYLDWAYEAFSNVQTQKSFANFAINVMSAAQSTASTITKTPLDHQPQIEAGNDTAK